MNFALLQKQPWLIEPEAFAVLFEASRSFFSSQEQPADPPASSLLTIEDGVGVVSIRGPMLRRPGILDRVFLQACDTEEVMAAIEEAVSREDVQAIFLDIDSPGGSVNGTPELARAVAEATKAKYTYAFTSGQMCSAAYWVASQADAIYATPSARVGSIGVILPVLDSSAAFEKAGLKIEVFAAGKFKSAGSPGTSLTDEQREWLQSEVEETFTEFRSAVLARGRKIPDEAMDGQTFSARRAQRFNLPEKDEKLIGFAAHPSGMAVAMRYLVPVAQYDEAGAVTDPETGLTFGYLRYTETNSNRIFVTVEALYGFKAGMPDGIKRIVKP